MSKGLILRIYPRLFAHSCVRAAGCCQGLSAARAHDTTLLFQFSMHEAAAGFPLRYMAEAACGACL